MRSLFFLMLILILTVSCKKETVEKPEDLIAPAKMEDILYELAVLNSAKGFSTTKFKQKSPLHETYIYEKYDVDSTRFANSSIYYATEPETYIAIYKNVEARLEETKKQFEATEKINDSLRKNKRDSLMLKRKSADKSKLVKS